MYKSQLTDNVNLFQTQNIILASVEQATPPNESAINEVEALSQLIDTSVRELSQPMRAVLCWSKLLLSETDPYSPLALDLEIIVAEAKRMNEIIRGLNLLVDRTDASNGRATGRF